MARNRRPYLSAAQRRNQRQARAGMVSIIALLVAMAGFLGVGYFLDGHNALGFAVSLFVLALSGMIGGAALIWGFEQ